MRRVYAVVAVCVLPVTALAAEVGRFAVVQNDVRSLKPGASAPVAAIPGSGIVVEERETTGVASGAKLTFGEGAVISLGEKTTFAVTRQAVDQATGASTSTLDLAIGRARVFVSRFWGGRPKVDVNTPTAVVGIKGSEVAIDVAEDGATTVTVISGEADVEAKATPGRATTVAAGGRLKVDPRGALRGAAERATAQEIAMAIRLSDPLPSPPPGALPETPATTSPPPAGAAVATAAGKSLFGAATATPSSSSYLWLDPATAVVPQSPGGQGASGR